MVLHYSYMNKNVLKIPLTCSAQQHARLAALQQTFALACNRVSEIARNNRCWNRVALHHLAYRVVREQFPDLGSQMACNAIYSVCRACRWAYQHPQSPLNAIANPERPLAPILFLNSAPVFFDRHTLSLSEGQLSMFTLDGRIHFKLGISQAHQRRFISEKLKEVALTQVGLASLAVQTVKLVRSTEAQTKPAVFLGFELVFWFESASTSPKMQKMSAVDLAPESQAVGHLTMQPPYLMASLMTSPAAAVPPHP